MNALLLCKKYKIVLFSILAIMLILGIVLTASPKDKQIVMNENNQPIEQEFMSAKQKVGISLLVLSFFGICLLLFFVFRANINIYFQNRSQNLDKYINTDFYAEDNDYDSVDSQTIDDSNNNRYSIASNKFEQHQKSKLI